jgi:hypothetical protein
MNKISKITAYSFSTIAVLFFTIFAVSEYLGCSPSWTSMCGTGLFFISITFALGIPLIATFVLDLIFNGLHINLSQDAFYIVGAFVIIIIVGIMYFFLGLLVGWLINRIKVFLKKDNSNI